MNKLFDETTLGNLQLKNRIFRAGCFEGMTQKGNVTENLVNHHYNVSKGGVALTTVAYCSVSEDGRVFDHELWIRSEIKADLINLTNRIHEGGAKASIQLGHSGFFTSQEVIGKQPMGASPKYCMFTKTKCREMTHDDINEKISDFVNGALLAKECGFDAIEIHAGHGYLLSQFLSPWTNKRTDEYGGSLENRLRFPTMVVKEIRTALGEDFPILVKMNQMDGMDEGVQIADAIEIAKAFEEVGASALIPSAGFTSKVPFLMLRGNLPVKEMATNQKKWIDKVGLKLFGKFLVPRHNYEPLFLIQGAREILKHVNIPVIYIGGAESLKHLNHLVTLGFSYIQIGRPTIYNPNFVNDLQSGKITKSGCDRCNRCVAAMDGGGVYCVTKKIGPLKK